MTTGAGCGIIAAKRLLYLGFKSFFSPLTGQPKKLTYDTILTVPSWYHIVENISLRRGGRTMGKKALGYLAVILAITAVVLAFIALRGA